MNQPSPGQRDIYSVSRLNREIRTLLETGFPAIWLEGELSNLARPASGHLYFSLKDEAAQVRCAMFRNRNLLLKFRPEAGLQVRVRARVSLYEARGDYQLIVEHMEEAGDGALRRAFDELKVKLEAAGLFASEHKQPLPRFPQRIGVITSPSGAAIRDIVTTLQRRFPGLPVVVYPVPVQGETAAPAIVEALHTAARRAECDVLILARGGGSLEDLWPFNEEQVARAIHNCPIPVVSGVGHETDVTIADFAADLRAPTPTAAAELVSPSRIEWQQSFSQLGQRLTRVMQQQLRQREQQLSWLARQLPHPQRYLQSVAQRLDELEIRRNNAWRYQLRERAARLDTVRERLQQHNPRHNLRHLEERRQQLTTRLARLMRRHLEDSGQRLQYLARALETVSPLATLSRGYAIVSTEAGDKIITDVKQISRHSRIRARLHRGRFIAVIERLEDE
ncbi:exodeoxyribonuclease VII large subunit [Thiohalophilus thiocyanatoxydans]|uniref:Exodeoxyribonuclease 7 large subunit n=1 Tax=Thiohalophilus thiocyanatoxydans TaxID=381308 RepID=A0A4R8IVL0_9GAMM|nr:exodeoxyribonuclease VII large subunit [Thiohalophilus thiocyanatoxydans]TDY01739.1 exodeoxyribonuclease VII large subunit [Thiohalophilus thiocyanatoxydans]